MSQHTGCGGYVGDQSRVSNYGSFDTLTPSIYLNSAMSTQSSHYETKKSPTPSYSGSSNLEKMAQSYIPKILPSEKKKNGCIKTNWRLCKYLCKSKLWKLFCT